MHCKRCGFSNDEGAMFCVSCGSIMTQDFDSDVIQENNIVTVPQMQQMQQMQSNPVPPVQQMQPMQSNLVPPVQPVQPMQSNLVPPVPPVQPMQSNSVPPVQLEKSQQPKTLQSQANISKQVEGATNDKNIVYPSIYTVSASRKENSFSKRKLSVPALVLSLIIMLATIGSVVTFFFGYAEINFRVTMDGETEKYSTTESAYDIIIDDSLKKDMSLPKNEASDDIIKNLDLCRYLIIGFVVAILLFGIIDGILLFVQRGRMACIFAMVFSMVKIAIGCGIIFIWSSELSEQIKELFEMIYERLSFKVAVDSFAPGIGLIIAMAMQAVIFIGAIVLMFVKPKHEDMSAVTMHA